MSWSHGEFYWNELMTHEVEAAKHFYEKAIGWRFEPMAIPNGTYWVAYRGDDPMGGVFEMKGPDFQGVPEHWMPYVAVDDVDARLKQAKAAGAETRRGPFDVPGVGRIAILRAPGGAMVGFMTPAKSG
jgi:uncharacterized protein